MTVTSLPFLLMAPAELPEDACPGVLRRYLARPPVIAELVVVGVLVISAVVTPWAMYSPIMLDLHLIFAQHTCHHPLGEVLPNTLPALLAQSSLNLATSVMLEATLSFVGLGVQPPQASWGTMLQNGYSHLYESIWYPLMPALVIVLAIAALNTLGSELQ